MRFEDIMEAIESSGMYMAVDFTEATQRAITEYAEIAKVPDPVMAPSLHCTLVYSRTKVPMEPSHDCNYEIAKVKGLELWPVADGKNVLVLTLESKYLTNRFNEAISLGATYDYDEYKPHITLSYDAGEFDIASAPPITFDVELNSEYIEELVH